LCDAFQFDHVRLAKWLTPRPKYADEFFKMLGASNVQSMDNSAYEGATLIHDLNFPTPTDLDAGFDLVYDGGTLEHVFNFPEALRNAMRMVRVGGSFIAEQCFNNMAGHGFYCFGPEIFFRTLCEANGFVLKNVRIYEKYPRSPWYRLSDPQGAGRRILLISWGLEVLILVHAVKISEKPIFQQWPQQSDYASAWSEGVASAVVSRSEREELGVETIGMLSNVRAKILRPIRRRALRSTMLGRVGKYWLNRQNYSMERLTRCMELDDPLKGGSGPLM
jgi:hypothetical protein